MTRVAMAAQMRDIDKRALDEFGLTESVLMENAGSAVFQEICKTFDGLAGKKVIVFAGTGNNGGDGFVAARYLHNAGADVKIFVLGDRSRLRGAAAVYYNVVVKMAVPVDFLLDEAQWQAAERELAAGYLVLDAVLGTGFRGGLRPAAERLIGMINAAMKHTVAVDVPSGVDSDSGAVGSVAVRASVTVTFGLIKVGLLLFPGAGYCGRVAVYDIGLPRALLELPSIKQYRLDGRAARDWLGERRPDAHKGSCGKVLVIAGSTGLTGAAALAAMSALRAGAGVVTLAIAASLNAVMEVKLTEVMTAPMPDDGLGTLGVAALDRALELAAKCRVAVIGPGLGRDEDTAEFIRRFVSRANCQLVIDADAIAAFAEHGQLLSRAASYPVLTPHVGEMAMLTGASVREVEADLIGTARSAARRYGSIVVLKSARTVVAHPDGIVYINIKGNAGMATAGSGDVLAGTIGGLLAQGTQVFGGTAAGVYLHSCAGDIAAAKAMIGLTAGDILINLLAARHKLAAVEI